MATTEIIVCTTCRPAGVSRDLPAAGLGLFEAVQSILDADAFSPSSCNDLTLHGVACMNGCSRACTVALQAGGKFTYYFGDLGNDAETAAQVVQCARLHHGSQDGNLLRNDRPELLRNGMMAKLPALQSA